MTLRDALRAGTLALTEAGIEEAANDAWLLMQSILRIDKGEYLVQQDEDMSEDEGEEYRILITKRAEHIPLQYITGETYFMGYRFTVNSNVLIPRFDTENLVEEVRKRLKPDMKVLDMCTGSGCIIVSLMRLVPGIKGTGADISKQALLVAKENAYVNGVPASFICSDMFENIEDRYDVIVSNPPYIATSEIAKLMPEVRDFEPAGALDGWEDGLHFYEILAKQAKDYLKLNGWLCLEIGYDQGQAVSQLLMENGFKEVEVKQDLSGLDRVVCGHFV